MNIYPYKIKDYYMARLCVTGELPCIGLARVEEFDYTHSTREIKKLNQEKLIRTYRYPDNKRFYRLSDPNGTEAMKEFPEELRYHLDMMIGPKGERYKRSVDYRLKQRRIFEVADMFAKHEVSVDLIKIIKPQSKIGRNQSITEAHGPSIFLGDGTRKTFQDILERIPKDEPVFLTNKVMYKISEAFTPHPKEHMYRAIGLLIKGLNVYSVYYINSTKEIWWKDVETSLAHHTVRFAKSHLEAYEEIQGNRLPMKKAIFYMSDAGQVIDFLDTEKPTLKPNDVYDLAYIVPLKENAFDISRMLMERNWKPKLDEILFEEVAKREDICDGYIKGVPGYNLLCLNLAEYKKKINHLRNKRGIIFTHDWMAEYVRKKVSEKAEVVSVNGEDFLKFYEAILV